MTEQQAERLIVVLERIAAHMEARADPVKAWWGSLTPTKPDHSPAISAEHWNGHPINTCAGVAQRP